MATGSDGPEDELHDDKMHEECGVFGLWNATDAAAVTALGLHALQHRGQAATGIVSFDGQHFHSHRGLGLVGDNFGDAKVIASLPGAHAVGHNRYATTGETMLRNVQPAEPIQFWLVRSSPGVRCEPRTPSSSLAWISRIRRTDTGSVASRASPWFIAAT